MAPPRKRSAVSPASNKYDADTSVAAKFGSDYKAEFCLTQQLRKEIELKLMTEVDTAAKTYADVGIALNIEA